MQATAIHDAPDFSHAEYLPPLDEPWVWGLPWERQLEAVYAWQETYATVDDEACQWRDAFAPVTPASTVITMQTVVRLNTLNVALRERLMQISNEVSNIAIAEMARRKDGPADGSTVSAASPPAAPEPVDERNAQRLAELTRGWFELVAAAQAGMSALTGYVPRSGQADTTQSATRRPLVERRQCVIAVDFADRRKAG